MSDGLRSEVHLFLYGRVLGDDEPTMLAGCERVGGGTVRGALYQVPSGPAALLLAGPGAVRGEVWRCPAHRIAELDRHEAVRSGRFRRVGVEVEGRGCWTLVAGPALAAGLRGARRLG